MKKVYLLVNDLYSLGGTERATINLGIILANHNYSVEILSIYTDSNENTLEDLDIKVKNLGLIQSRSFFYRQLNLIIALHKLKVPRNSLFIGTNVGVNTVLALLAKIRNWKTIGCEHLIYEDTSRINRIIRRLLYRLLDRVVVLTKDDQKSYTKRKIRTWVIPNSLPFYPKDSQISTTDNKKLLAVGRLTATKGFDKIIPLIAPILVRHPDWTLDIVGEGELMKIMENQIDSFKIGDQIFLRGSTRSVEDYYGNSSIFLLTSNRESFGMVLIEAQAFGLPIVSYDSPHGPRDILIDSENGFLVDMEDTISFTEKTEYLMLNPEKRREFSANARNNVKKYSKSKIALLWVNLIEEIYSL